MDDANRGVVLRVIVHVGSSETVRNQELVALAALGWLLLFDAVDARLGVRLGLNQTFIE
jgi:hypothetical protein